MSKETKAQKQEREEAIVYLRKILRPGDTIGTIVRHVSKSGMYREISCYFIPSKETKTRRFQGLDYYVARAIGRKIGRHGGLQAHGCGMDMAFQIVYNLGQAVWPDGTPTPHGRRNGQPDTAGGYALQKTSL